MSSLESENKRRMRQFIEAWNDQDTERILSFLGEDMTQFTESEFRTICESWFTAFPELTHEIKELAANDDWVLGRALLRGTHRDTFDGLPATGASIEVADHFSTRFDNGQIVEHHTTADLYGLFEQLNVTSPAARRREAEHEALMRRYYEALNDRDKAAFRDTLAEDFSFGAIEGRESMVENEWRWIEAMDLTWDIHAMHAAGEIVTTRLEASGTHRGEILGLDVTGESFTVSAIAMSRIEDGLVGELWAEWDFAALLNEIGVIDAPRYTE